MFPEFESEPLIQRLREVADRHCPQVANIGDCQRPCSVHALVDDRALLQRLLTAYGTREAYRLQEFGQPT